MVSAQDSGSCGPGSSPGRDICGLRVKFVSLCLAALSAYRKTHASPIRRSKRPISI